MGHVFGCLRGTRGGFETRNGAEGIRAVAVQ
jgi:hypothetical protein